MARVACSKCSTPLPKDGFSPCPSCGLPPALPGPLMNPSALRSFLWAGLGLVCLCFLGFAVLYTTAEVSVAGPDMPEPEPQSGAYVWIALSSAALLLGLSSLFCAPILGVRGLAQIRASEGRSYGRFFAVMGIIYPFALILLVLALLLFALLPL